LTRREDVVLTGSRISIKRRLLALLIIFTLVVIILLGRIAYIQIVQGEELQKMAFIQQNSSRTISPRRGTIYDRNGKELAISASVDTISAFPSEIKNSGKSPEDIAEKLAEILEMDKEEVYKNITKNVRYVLVKRKVEKDVGDRVRQWIQEEKIEGIYIDEDTKRYYPGRNLAAHIIGFTNVDNEGLYGIEKIMDKYLKGTPGRILSEVDVIGRELPFKTEKRIDPQDGLNVVLTIDETIQYFAQKAIEKAVVDNKVQKGAIAIVMDPRNGDILAMVSYPDYDLNNPYAPPPGQDPSTWIGSKSSENVKLLSETVWRNKAVQDTYEPGSTFKVITSAAALEEGIVKPEDMISDSPVQIGKWTIRSYSSYRYQGQVSFRVGVYKSVNPVFVRLAQKMGIEKFYQYVRAFGFYDKTGIDLEGEGKSIFQEKPAEIDMAVASFGQRFTITPIQLITAYTAIANGGKMMKPRLVKEVTDQEGNIIKKFEPEVIRTVISKQTSDTLREILEGVVSEGTGRNAYVKGYRVAGKTGTSQTTHGSDVYTASFCAFAPADNPVICVLVALFDPRGDSYMGGAIAAPVAGKIIEDTLEYLQVERRYTEKDMEEIREEVYVPDVRNKTVSEAIKTLADRDLRYRIEGDKENKEAIVVEQTPKPDASIQKKSVIVLYTYKPEEEVMVKVPDVLNMSVPDATEILRQAGLNIKVVGSGTAYRQSVVPGEEVTAGAVIEVEFKYLEVEDGGEIGVD